MYQLLHENYSSPDNSHTVMQFPCPDMRSVPHLLASQDPLFLYNTPQTDTPLPPTTVTTPETLGDSTAWVTEEGDTAGEEREEVVRACRTVEQDHVAAAVSSLCQAQGLHQLLLIYTGDWRHH